MAGYWIILSIAAVLIAWAVAFVVAFGVLLAVSLDGIGQLAIRAARSSAPAMWLPPAMLLVAERTPRASGIGFLVIVAQYGCWFSILRRRVSYSCGGIPAGASRSFVT